MDITTATRSFEDWLGRAIPLVRDDLDYKHETMGNRKGVWPFLRATFYRWAQQWPNICAGSVGAPTVLGIGDLHLANFGTWRDDQGRLAWGINDFDEAFPLPYTNDLTRLAASAILAGEDQLLDIGPRAACGAILDGYCEGVAAVRTGSVRPMVIDEDHEWLGPLVVARDSGKFWKDARRDVNEHPARPPAGVRRALAAVLPVPLPSCLYATRRAGVGSLGKPRFVGLADWEGGPLLREAKAITPSACSWALGQSPSSPSHLGSALAAARRSADPWLIVHPGWVVRRLAPDCVKVELEPVGSRRDEARLLAAMGTETAHAHAGPHSQRIARDLRRRGREWLLRDAKSMADAVESDWRKWIAAR